jgi:hypothetical protein
MGFMDKAPEEILLEVSRFRTDGGTQSREHMNKMLVSEYCYHMKAGARFPSLEAFFDGTSYWLIDGFHRLEGAKQAGVTQLYCAIHKGTLEQARWQCLAANATNSLHRSNRDKAFAVGLALAHPMSAGMSDGLIGGHVGVSGHFVGNCRRASTQNGSESIPRTGRDGRTIHVHNIRKLPDSAAPAAEQPISASLTERRLEALSANLASEPYQVPDLPGLGPERASPPAAPCPVVALPAPKPPAFTQHADAEEDMDSDCERALELSKEVADFEITGEKLHAYVLRHKGRLDVHGILGTFEALSELAGAYCAINEEIRQHVRSRILDD